VAALDLQGLVAFVRVTGQERAPVRLCPRECDAQAIAPGALVLRLDQKRGDAGAVGDPHRGAPCDVVLGVPVRARDTQHEALVPAVVEEAPQRREQVAIRHRLAKDLSELGLARHLDRPVERTSPGEPQEHGDAGAAELEGVDPLLVRLVVDTRRARLRHRSPRTTRPPTQRRDSLISLLIVEISLIQSCRSRCSIASRSSSDQWKW